MPNSKPIVIIEDDLDDQDFIAEVLKDLQVQNRVIFFSNGDKALNYLKTTPDKPFLILCDINMPQINGIELKNAIEQDVYLKSKSIPFIFLTTTANTEAVKTAFQLSAQGFFQKPNSIIEMKSTLKKIVEYWRMSQHPNSNLN